jgi:hypothetical protein
LGEWLATSPTKRWGWGPLVAILVIGVGAGYVRLAGAPRMSGWLARLECPKVSSITGGVDQEPPAGLAAMLASAAPTGLTLQEDGPMDATALASATKDPDARSELRTAGFTSAYGRCWSSGSISVGEDVLQFASPPGAVRYERARRRFLCRFRHEVYRVPDIPDARGLTIFRRAGGYEQRVAFVRGIRVFVLNVYAPTRFPPSADVRRFARGVNDLAA